MHFLHDRSHGSDRGCGSSRSSIGTTGLTNRCGRTDTVVLTIATDGMTPATTAAATRGGAVVGLRIGTPLVNSSTRGSWLNQAKDQRLHLQFCLLYTSPSPRDS